MLSTFRACLRFNYAKNSTLVRRASRFAASNSDEFIDHTSRNGYKAECYAIKTNDGYHLKLHKILAVNKKSDKNRSVLLMHGLARHSMDYLASGREVSLAYFLADSGFDVWLGNSRDTKLCTKHDEFPLYSKDFLNYNLHHIGIFDLRAFIEFILNRTDGSSISYIGHSQGGCTILILLSMLPEFNAYINQAHLLTPAAFLGAAKSPLLTLSAEYENLIQVLYDRVNRINLTGLMKMGKLMNKSLSEEERVKRARIVYEKFTCAIIGRNRNECEISDAALACFEDLVTPYWSSTHLRHFLQLHMSEKFQQFDFGPQLNRQFYNSSTPPEYNLQAVTSPTHLYSGAEDLLVDPRDVEKLRNLLPNVKCCENIVDWNHMDVLLGKNARNVLYGKILDSLNG